MAKFRAKAAKSCLSDDQIMRWHCTPFWNMEMVSAFATECEAATAVERDCGTVRKISGKTVIASKPTSHENPGEHVHPPFENAASPDTFSLQTIKVPSGLQQHFAIARNLFDRPEY
eukprot:6320212-Amphidinium_carterae.1